MRRWSGRVGAALLVVAALVAGSVGADQPVGANSDTGAGGVVALGGFSDVGDGVHQAGIDVLDTEGVFEGTGCGEGLFCPDDPIRRWVMAVWLVRVLDNGEDPPGSESSRFSDVDPGVWWTPYVERLAELEVTTGCATGPLRFCPDEAVTRAQMATFIVRAFGLDDAAAAGFADTGGNTHASSIDALAAAGVTAGCATSPARFCPTASVTRAQMATFVARAAGLVELPDPPPDDDPSPVPNRDVPVTKSQFSAVAAGIVHTCGLRTDGAVSCWEVGGLGIQTGVEGWLPSEGEYVALAVNHTQTCGIGAVNRTGFPGDSIGWEIMESWED